MRGEKKRTWSERGSKCSAKRRGLSASRSSVPGPWCGVVSSSVPRGRSTRRSSDSHGATSATCSMTSPAQTASTALSGKGSGSPGAHRRASSPGTRSRARRSASPRDVDGDRLRAGVAQGLAELARAAADVEHRVAGAHVREQERAAQLEALGPRVGGHRLPDGVVQLGLGSHRRPRYSARPARYAPQRVAHGYSGRLTGRGRFMHGSRDHIVKFLAALALVLALPAGARAADIPVDDDRATPSRRRHCSLREAVTLGEHERRRERADCDPAGSAAERRHDRAPRRHVRAVRRGGRQRQRVRRPRRDRRHDLRRRRRRRRRSSTRATLDRAIDIQNDGAATSDRPRGPQAHDPQRQRDRGRLAATAARSGWGTSTARSTIGEATIAETATPAATAALSFKSASARRSAATARIVDSDLHGNTAGGKGGAVYFSMAFSEHRPRNGFVVERSALDRQRGRRRPAAAIHAAAKRPCRGDEQHVQRQLRGAAAAGRSRSALAPPSSTCASRRSPSTRRRSSRRRRDPGRRRRPGS